MWKFAHDVPHGGWKTLRARKWETSETMFMPIGDVVPHQGQLGCGLTTTPDICTPILVDRLQTRVVTHVACGYLHTVCKTLEDQVWSWGLDEGGPEW